jgi:phage protein D/phage baseplate assembly protein gpV
MTDIATRDTTKVLVDGTELSKDQLKFVKLLSLDSSLHVPDMVEILIAELSVEELEQQPYAVGKPIKVSLSNESNQLTPLFEGEITAIEPIFEKNYASMIIRGYDKAHRMHRGTISKDWKNVKDSDIAQQIASKNGMQAKVDATSEVFDHVFQHAQSDFEFLQSRASRIGYSVFTENGKLNFVKPSAPSSPDKTLEFRKNLIAFRPRMSLSEQVTEVTVRGWDVKAKKAIVGTATSSDTGASTGNGKTGTQATKTAFGDAKRLFVRDNINSQGDATALAEALMNQSNEHFIEADGEAEGIPTLHAGQVVEIVGVGTKFGGKYRLTSVRHEYRKGTYQTYFRIEGRKPQLLSDMFAGGSGAGEGGGGESRWHGVVTALVTNNNPENPGTGMVKLKYPWLSDETESHWARIAMPGAGPDRGFYIVPEVNDEVLVAFEQGNFDKPIVIGGLFNGKDKAPLTPGDTVTGGKTFQRQWKTRTGHSITLYDDNSGKEYIEIKDAKANTQVKFDTTEKKITMQSTDKVEILATGDMTLKSSSGNITIEAAQNVKIKGMNYEAEGQSSAKLKSGMTTTVEGTTTTVKGSGTAELSSSGITTVRGSMVNIN